MASSNTQYKKIKEYDDLLWGLDSPVTVEKMKLCFDKLYGVNVLQVTFRNVSQSNMYGLSISVGLKDGSNKKIRKDIDFNYYAMEVLPGKTFGPSEDIIVEPEAENFDIIVKGADLADGLRNFTKVELGKIPNPQPLATLGNLEELFIQRYSKKYPRAKLISVPEIRVDYWRCGCGHIWPNDMQKCLICNIKKDELFEILPQIKQEEKERLAAEAKKAAEEEKRRKEEERIAEEKRLEEERLAAEEAARLAEEERLRKEQEEAERLAAEKAKKEKQKKIIMWSSIAAAIAICACLLIFVVIPKAEAKRDSELKAQASAEADERIQAKAEEIETEIKKLAEEKAKREAAMAAAGAPKSMVVAPADLSKKDEKTLWRLFGTTQEQLGDITSYEISTDQGHRYMDAMLGKDNVEETADSGILVQVTDEGGLNIKMYNISHYTEEDFASVLRDIGYENANVVVAACNDSSGSTAMLGLLLLRAAKDDGTEMILGSAIAKDNMNVRYGPATTYERYTTLTVGDEVQVLEFLDNGWMRISWPTSELGYAYTCYLDGHYYNFTSTLDQGVM